MYEALYTIYFKQRRQFMDAKNCQKHFHNFEVGQFVRVREANQMRGSQRKLRAIYSPTIYRILHITHSTAMLVDLSAQVYYKRRLKGRGKLITPILKRVKINQLKLTEKPEHFLKITDKQLQNVLTEINNSYTRNVGYIRKCENIKNSLCPTFLFDK